MNTFIANLRHAARNNETVQIGGGEFSPAELLAVAAAFTELVDALEFCAGTSYITDARDVANAALAKVNGSRP